MALELYQAIRDCREGSRKQEIEGLGMRSIFIAIFLGLVFAVGGTTPSLAQAGEKITGKTCDQLFRSCFKICALHKGEPAYRDCEADCNNGQRSCRSTGVWKSKNATVTVQAPAKKKR